MLLNAVKEAGSSDRKGRDKISQKYDRICIVKPNYERKELERNGINIHSFIP